MKPKKCDTCKYLYLKYLINNKKKICIKTKTGRLKKRYVCVKHNEPYYYFRDCCGGPYIEED
jgi:hypothetical protein